jgi:double-strand break repair protein MRE11
MDVDDDDEEIEPPSRVTRKAPPRKAAPAQATRQTQLQFAPSQASRRTTDSQASNALFHRNIVTIPSSDEDIEDDEEDEFVPMASQRGSGRR